MEKMNNQIHVMVDLETFGVGPTAAIVQVAAVKFDPFETKNSNDRFNHIVNLTSSILNGGTIDNSTVEWWSKQEENAIKNITSGLTHNIIQTLDNFSSWMPNEEELGGIWSNGASFDIPILEYHYKKANKKIPWTHKKVFDTRTVKLLYTSVFGLELLKTKVTTHNAIDDALKQAEEISYYITSMKAKTCQCP